MKTPNKSMGTHSRPAWETEEKEAMLKSKGTILRTDPVLDDNPVGVED